MAESAHEVADDALAAIDYCYEQGWAADGLPVIPPERSRVEAMVAMEGRPPETILANHPTTGLECSVQSAAVNAVMAGCLPEYFPVIVAALEAANEPAFNFHASAASTGGSTPMMIVSGPVVQDIGMNAAGNVFGPGEEFAFGDLRYSVGMSAVWLSPLGPLTLSVAAPLKKEDQDDTQALQFTFGTSF